jgi:anti-anti-sigma factor
MTTPLTLDTTCDDGKVVVIAEGEIDQSNIEEFDQALATAATEAAAGGGTLTVDLRDVEYLDSAAINALFAYAEHIRLIVAHSLLIPVLNVSGLTKLVTTELATPAVRTQPQQSG